MNDMTVSMSMSGYDTQPDFTLSGSTADLALIVKALEDSNPEKMPPNRGWVLKDLTRLLNTLHGRRAHESA